MARILKQSLAVRLSAAAFTLALLFGAGLSFGLGGSGATVERAVACNPCNCENDRRLNCQGVEFYAVYVRTYNDPTVTCALEMYRIVNQDGGLGRPVMRVSNVTIDRFPANGTTQLIRQNQGIALYRLPSGELQINAGPDGEGKIYTLRIDSCLANTRFEQSFVIGQ